MNRATALAYAEQNADRFLADLMDYLAIPSISARTEHASDVRRAAEFTAAKLEGAGLTASVVDGDGHPLVLARSPEVPGAPTVILYGHHDVQPVDPLDLWETPPFEPAIVDGMIRARGCADDKGPALAQVFGVESWMKGVGGLPLNVIVLIEGEEEVGGSVLPTYIEEHRDELAADAVIIMDCPGYAAGVPALAYGLRGICTLEVRVDGPSRDLHSGSYGGAVKNPAEALCEMLASCRAADGGIAIPGVVAGVTPLSADERARLATLEFDEAAFLADVGSPETFGEEGFSCHERRWGRPTFEVNGIFGGYQGDGSKTIVPAWAGAKLSLRLVPDQDPQAVLDAVEAHLLENAPRGVTVTVTKGFGAPAILVDVEGPAAVAARKAMAEAYDTEPKLTREGGSIPVVATFADMLGVTPLLVGTYRPGEKAHSPNEQYHPDDFQAAIRTSVTILETLAEELS